MNKTDKLLLAIAVSSLAIIEGIHLFLCFWEVEHWLPFQAYAWIVLCLIFVPLDISLLGLLYFVRNALQRAFFNRLSMFLNITIIGVSIINIICYIASSLNLFQSLVSLPTYSFAIIVICFIIDILCRKKWRSKETT